MDLIDKIIGMRLDSGSDYLRIYIVDGDGNDFEEVVYWHRDEWEEDEDVLDSMENAVNLFHNDRERLLRLLGKV